MAAVSRETLFPCHTQTQAPQTGGNRLETAGQVQATLEAVAGLCGASWPSWGWGGEGCRFQGPW